MSQDDDMLAEYDLSAWEAPPPPTDLADAVIDRMGGTDVAIAMPEEGPQRQRVWIIGGAAVAVVVLALGVWSLIRSTRPAAPTSGAVVADKARTLSLDNVHATMDEGAELRWKRDGDVLFVEQRTGRVMWHVDNGEKLVIDAGAKFASVETTGGNLRVEVQMNAMDARVIGASALTAAAVAMVTVVVYEGHVKVGRGSNQTVVVAPGSTYEIKGEESEAPVVGGTVGNRVGLPKVAILGLELVDPKGAPNADEPVVVQVLSSEMRAVAKTEGPYLLAPNTDKELVDEKLLLNCANEAVECMAKLGSNLGVDMLVFGHVEHARGVGWTISLKLLDVAKKQLAVSGQWVMPDAEAEGTGLTTWARRSYLALTDDSATTCDADALKEQGVNFVSLGQHAAALAKFEASLRCKFNSYVLQLAFMESCASSNSPKAKLFFKQLSPAQQQKFAMMCIRTNTAYIDDGAPDPDKCDEVSCVLNNYEGDCCQKFRKSKTPDTISRSEITSTIQKAKGELMACGDKAPEGGKVSATVEVNATGTVINATATSSPKNDALSKCVTPILEKLTFAAAKRGTTFTYPIMFTKRATPPANCDAEALKEEGVNNVSLGQHAAALAKFEASLRCKFNSYVLQLAFAEACASSNSPKATVFYKQLSPAQQQKFAQMCIRTNTPYQGGCDADALKEQGVDMVSLGQHAASLAKFEASLRCKPSSYVLQLAFMEACASSNSPKAKAFYKQLSRDAQNKFAQMCERTNTAYDDSKPAVDPSKGYAQLFTKPPGAKVMIDGVDTGLKTPISGHDLPLAPGKHKVTFTIGVDRFTYPIVIETGETATMSKDLQ